MASVVFDIQQLYRQTFGSNPYTIAGQSPAEVQGERFVLNGRAPDLTGTLNSQLKTTINGIEIWLPTTLVAGSIRVELPYSVIRVTGKKTIVKTPLMDRRGSVKEHFAVDDYQFTLKGFLIDPDRIFPEKDMLALRRIFELQESVQLINPIASIFLSYPEANGSAEDMDKVVLEDLDFPEVQGGRTHVRPFTMKMESDSIFTLEVQE